MYLCKMLLTILLFKLSLPLYTSPTVRCEVSLVRRGKWHSYSQ